MMESSLLMPLEHSELSEVFKSNYNNLIKLKSFFSFINRNAHSFNTKLQYDLNTILPTDPLEDSNEKQSSQRGCNYLYHHSITCLKEIEQVIESIFDQLVSPLESFSRHYLDIYKETRDEMKSISNEYSKAAQSLDKAKAKYFKAASQTYEHENKMNKDLKAKVNMPIEELTHYHDTLLRLRAQTENFAQLYKYEITKVNQLKEQNEKKHGNLRLRIKVNEEARISVIKEVISKYGKIMTTYKKIQEKVEQSVLGLSDQIDIQSDIEAMLISEELNGNKVEVFREYIPPEVNEKEDNMIKAKDNHSKIDLSSEFEIVDQIKEYSNQYQDIFIREFVKKLKTSNEVSPEEISKIIEMHNQNSSSLFPRCFLSKFSSTFHRLSNYANLLHLATILNSFCFNSSDYKKDLNAIYSSIIILSGRVCYSNITTSETVYLCAVLSNQNEVYSTKSFWKEVIQQNLKVKIEASLNSLLQSDVVKPKKEKKKKDFFEMKKNKPKVIPKKSMLEVIGMAKELKNYHLVPEYKLPYLDNFASNDLYDILFEFIPYLCQFNYPMIQSTELITELAHSYNIRSDKRGYLTLHLLSCDLTAKKAYLNKDKKVALTKEQVLSIKMKRNKNYLLMDKKSSLPKIAITLLSFISHYLTINEVLSIFLLNKDTLKEKKRIMKNYFKHLPNISVNETICLWFSLLNYGVIRRKYNYKESCEKAEEGVELKFKTLIGFDVERTSFPTDIEEHQKTLNTILLAMAYSKPDINYCQGMNYITSFVLQLFNYREEPTYYFMLALFDTMQYEEIYSPMLLKLKSSFFILEHLISYYLPKLSDLFLEINISVNYFCPPWFLTLFSNSATYVDLAAPPKIVLKIWTDFFLSGWKSLYISSIALLKLNEPHIFKLKFGEILTFIINNVSSSSMIDSKDYDDYMKLVAQYNIKKNIISNLESEYELFKQLNNID